MSEESKEIVLVDKQDALQEAKRKQYKVAVSAKLAEQINHAYTDYTGLADNVIELGLTIENKRIVLGTLLITAKQTVGHGRFMRWVADNCPSISQMSACRFMAFSKANGGKLLKSVEDLREYRKLLERLGLRETTEGLGHGVQQLHVFNAFALATKSLGKARETFALIFEKKPLVDWTEPEKEQLRAQLEPLIDVYESLE